MGTCPPVHNLYIPYLYLNINLKPVVNAGKLKEIDKPYSLLTRPDSEFRGLAEQSNEFDEILAIAKEKAGVE